MDGPTLSWYQWMHIIQQLNSWTSFKKSLLQYFGSSLYRDMKGELAKMQQTTTVQEFYNCFEELANQRSGIPPFFLQSCFESGLRSDIRREVRASQPQTLVQAFQLAKLMEDRLVDKTDANRQQSTHTYLAKSIPTILSNSPWTKQEPASNMKAEIPVHRLTTTQV